MPRILLFTPRRRPDTNAATTQMMAQLDAAQQQIVIGGEPLGQTATALKTLVNVPLIAPLTATAIHFSPRSLLQGLTP